MSKSYYESTVISSAVLLAVRIIELIVLYNIVHVCMLYFVEVASSSLCWNNFRIEGKEMQHFALYK